MTGPHTASGKWMIPRARRTISSRPIPVCLSAICYRTRTSRTPGALTRCRSHRGRLREAREHATDLLETVRKGIDPVEAARLSASARLDRKKVDQRLAFSSYADMFIKKHAEARGLRSTEDIRAVFRRDLKPVFKDKPISDISRVDVRECLESIAERSGSAANKAHSWLRKMFAFAVDKDDIKSSPMEDMAPPGERGERERVLRGVELRHVWDAATELGHPFGTLAKLLLITGQRLREVAGMRWEEVDLDAGLWTIPAERAKNKREHLCPLSDVAISILRDQAGDEKRPKGLILSTNGKVPVSGFSKAKKALDEKVAEQVAKASVWLGGEPEPLAPWVFHDLRRSFASGCQALGIPIEHTEALLNHVSGKRGGIVAVYQKHEYLPEKVRAARAWGHHVEAIVNGEDGGTNVVALAGARG